MIDHDDVEHILHQLGVDFSQKLSGNEFAVFEVLDFGVKVVWSLTKYEEMSNDWNVVIVYPYSELSIVREEIIWELAKGGFFHFLRTNFPNTFNKMLAGRSGEDWHRKIINKRLELYGTKKMYNYYRLMNKDKMNVPFAQILSIDPGFYDFII